jgi:hypothetical protein
VEVGMVAGDRERERQTDRKPKMLSFKNYSQIPSVALSLLVGFLIFIDQHD